MSNIFEMMHEKLGQEGRVIKVRLDDTCFAGSNIEVTPTLDMGSAMSFARAIADDCTDYEQAQYMPEIFDFSVRVHTVEFFTNMEVSTNMDVMYEILYRTSLFDTIFDHVNQDQFRMLVSQAQELVNFKREMLISTAAKHVKEVVDMLAEFAGGVEKLTTLTGSKDFQDYMERLMPPAHKKKQTTRKPRKKASPAPAPVVEMIDDSTSQASETDGKDDSSKVIPIRMPVPVGVEQDG